VDERLTVQDSQREIDLANLFELTRSASRIQEDAQDENANFYELKTTTKNVVSTARDFGPKHIEKWKNRYWLIARGHNFASGFTFEKIYFLSNCHMDQWYYKHLDKFDTDTAFITRIASAIQDHHERIIATRMMKRGMLLNDPGISWSYVESNGILIQSDHAKTLRRLVEEFPLSLPAANGTSCIMWNGRFL
jgi:hypothetical protein